MARTPPPTPTLALNFFYHQFLTELFELEPTAYDEFFFARWGLILFGCVLPALLEETAFRGIIQFRLEKVVSPWVAITVASVIFSIAHYNFLSAPYLALVGLLLGWIRFKTGSLYPCMPPHPGQCKPDHCLTEQPAPS